MHRYWLTAQSSARELEELGRSLTGAVRVLVLEGDWSGPPIPPPQALFGPDLLCVAVLSGSVRRVGLALACDLRVADTAASFHHEPLPAGGKTLLAGGSARVLQWCLTGRQVSAQEWDGAGLLSVLVTPGELDKAVAALVHDVAALPASLVAEAKVLLTEAGRRTAHEQWQAEEQARARASQEE